MSDARPADGSLPTRRKVRGWQPRLAYFDRSAVKDNARKVKRYYEQTLRPVLESVRSGAAR